MQRRGVPARGVGCGGKERPVARDVGVAPYRDFALLALQLVDLPLQSFDCEPCAIRNFCHPWLDRS